VFSVEVEQRDIGAESKVPLDELCHKAVERSLGARSAPGVTAPGLLAQVSALVSALEAAWRRREAHAAVATALELHSAAGRRLQLELTTYHWLHHASLQGIPGLSPPPFSK